MEDEDEVLELLSLFSNGPASTRTAARLIQPSKPSTLPVLSPNVVLKEPQIMLSSLPPELLQAICAQLQGDALVSLGKAAATRDPIQTAVRKEVMRRERSPETALAKADATARAAADVFSVILNFTPAIKPLSTDELVRIHAALATHAQRAEVPLSELMQGKLRADPVNILGSSHRPPQPSHVEGLLAQCLDVAHGAMMQAAVQTGKVQRAALSSIAGFIYWRIVWVHPFLGEQPASYSPM